MTYSIPYRSLLPQGTDNLLLAGRCISGTHAAHGSYRVMPICFAMGQAAGAAAALCAARGHFARKPSHGSAAIHIDGRQQAMTPLGVLPGG